MTFRSTLGASGSALQHDRKPPFRIRPARTTTDISDLKHRVHSMAADALNPPETISTKKSLPSLTAGRGIAALIVALHHATDFWGGPLAPLGNVGWLGVSYFYLLSGFVLTWTFRPDAKHSTFYINRIARIYPLHVATLIAAIAGYFLVRAPFGGYIGTPLGTIASLFLIHDWIPGHPAIRQGWNGVSWSLSAEAFFYVLAPFLIKGLSKMQTRRLGDVCIFLYFANLAFGAIAGELNLPNIMDFLIYSPLARLPEFIYGACAGLLFIRGARFAVTNGARYLFFLPIPIYYTYAHGAINPVIMTDMAVPAFLVFIMSGATRDVEHRAKHILDAGFRAVGEASYSLYMTHALLLACFGWVIYKLKIHPNSFVAIAIFLGCSILLALGVHRAFEQPARRWFLRIAAVFNNAERVGTIHSPER